ncbi:MULTISPECIES: hypothetical protein [Bradyrhizobium]|uniref:hypothetical protein n=1 Tax=Bradyrhizobium TaxID=374 RepID=UPI0012FD0C4A|nr:MULTISPECIES: hypothetical protein [Bradyrhizobium]MBR1034343.1 hypothetical protein [Bradyrhizobium liaoningense]MCP1774885.1 hypothetical protein [Bradyrhizobium japonicum]MCP1962115.1 hypothetical protein [Bradyrhizobium japonicum]MDI2078246.1 hypothetical protein [Bradyrhizobium sp. Mp27]
MSSDNAPEPAQGSKPIDMKSLAERLAVLEHTVRGMQDQITEIRRVMDEQNDPGRVGKRSLFDK